jgi:hypothetical protein
VPTRILDEDTYPVGGYSSVSNRGSIESLLHSQLAYMEQGEGPDMFDIKFLRDELLYYSRDENQFLRRRRAFFIALSGDLIRARFKDPELPVQRIVLLLSLCVAAVRKLSEWLSTDALLFVITVIDEGDPALLADELGLLAQIFRDAIANGTVQLRRDRDWQALTDASARQARRSLCHALLVGMAPPEIEADDTLISRLVLQSATPQLVLPTGMDHPTSVDGDGPLRAWPTVLERLLTAWS